MQRNSEKAKLASKKSILIAGTILTYVILSVTIVIILRRGSEKPNLSASTLLQIGGGLQVLLGLLLAIAISKIALLPDSRLQMSISDLNIDVKRTLNPKDTGSSDPRELEEIIASGLAQFDEQFESQKQFVADAIHELNTPAALLRLSIDSYRKRMGEAQIFDYVFMDTIDHATKRIENLIKQIENLNAKAGQEANSMIDIQEMIQHVNDLASKIASHKKITIEEKIDGNNILFSNKAFIQSILINLLDNAIKYSPVETSILVSVHCEEQDCVFVVQDQGFGIPEKELPHVIKRFYRTSQSRSRKAGGSGLGLAITDEMVRKLGGTLNISSELGKGTLVTVSIPNQLIEPIK